MAYNGRIVALSGFGEDVFATSPAFGTPQILGVLIGAALAGGIGALVAKEHRGVAGAIGAVVGGAGGYFVGNYAKNVTDQAQAAAQQLYSDVQNQIATATTTQVPVSSDATTTVAPAPATPATKMMSQMMPAKISLTAATAAPKVLPAAVASAVQSLVAGRTAAKPTATSSSTGVSSGLTTGGGFRGFGIIPSVSTGPRYVLR